MKKMVSIMLSLVLCIFSSGFGFANEKTTITILHTNDIHAHVTDNGKDNIGFAKMQTFVSDYKKNNNVLLLDAGDMFQGLPFANLEKGHSMIPIVNKIGYDAMTAGNHEFDFGAQNLLEIKDKLNFDVLSANVYKDGKPVFKQNMIKDINGVKVGIFGLSTPETYFKTHPDNVKGYEFKDPKEISKEMVNQLKKEGASVIVALAHLGVDEGTPTSAEVAESVDGIDVIIDGHSHTKLDNGKMVNDTLIVSAHTGLTNIGKVELVVENGKIVDKKASLLNYTDLKDVAPNKDILAEIAKVEDAQKPILEKVIGTTDVDLVGDREVVRKGESNLGALAADAMLDLTHADMAITNGGGIRASIKKGNITMLDMITVFPYGNTIMVKDVKGEDIVKALEYGTSAYPELKGGFPHVAGITYTLNTQNTQGRVSDVKINGQGIQNDKMYSVATNDFMAAGGDGYEMFKKYPVKAEYNTLMDTLLAYVEKKGTIDGAFTPRLTINDSKIEQSNAQIATNVKVRDYASENGYKVGFDNNTQIITLEKDSVKITFKQGDKTFEVLKGGKNISGSFEKALENKENYNYLTNQDVKSIETLVAS